MKSQVSEPLEFGSIAYEGVSLGSGLPDRVDMGDNQRIVFSSPVQLDDFWKRDLGEYQLGHLTKSNFVVEIANPERGASGADIAGRLWTTLYSVLLFGMPRMMGGLQVLGTTHADGITIHRVTTPYPMGFCPYAKAAVIGGNTFKSAGVVVSGLRTMYKVGAEYFRLRRGVLAWLAGVRNEKGEDRLHQFVRAVEAVIKPVQGNTRQEFVTRAGLFALNGDILSELFELRSATEHMNDFSPIVTGDPQRDLDRQGWYRSFQAELLAQKVYTRILSDEVLLEYFRTDAGIDTFWGTDDVSRRRLWGKPVNLNQLADACFL